MLLVVFDARQKLPLSIRVTPGVGLEPPATYGLDQGREVASLARLVVGNIQFRLVLLQDFGISVGGQDGPDSRRRTRGAVHDPGVPGV
jgi:hypothetical protein